MKECKKKGVKMNDSFLDHFFSSECFLYTFAFLSIFLPFLFNSLYVGDSDEVTELGDETDLNEPRKS